MRAAAIQHNVPLITTLSAAQAGYTTPFPAVANGARVTNNSWGGGPGASPTGTPMEPRLSGWHTT